MSLRSLPTLDRYLFSAGACWGPPGDGKGAAAGEGDGDAGKGAAGAGDDAGAGAGDGGGAEGDAGGAGDGAGAGEGEGEGKGKGAPKKDGRATPWYSKRIAEEAWKAREATRKAEEADRRAAAAEALLERQRAAAAAGEGEGEGEPKPAPKPTRIDPRAVLDDPEVKAEIVRQAKETAAANVLVAETDKVFDKGVAEYGKAEFEGALATFKDFGGLRDDLARAITKIPNGHAVMLHLGTHPESISELYGLDAIDLALKVKDLSTELAPKRKEISKAPPVKEHVKPGGTVVPDLNDKELPMSEWVKHREEDLKRRGVKI